MTRILLALALSAAALEECGNIEKKGFDCFVCCNSGRFSQQCTAELGCACDGGSFGGTAYTCDGSPQPAPGSGPDRTITYDDDDACDGCDRTITTIASPCTTQCHVCTALDILDKCMEEKCPEVDPDVSLKEAPDRCDANSCDEVYNCKKNKKWACHNHNKLQKPDKKCADGACSADLKKAEICIVEALINDAYPFQCTISGEKWDDILDDCSSSDAACHAKAAGLAAMFAAFAAL